MHRHVYAPSSNGASPRDQLDLFTRTPTTLASTSIVDLTIFAEPCPYCGSVAAVVGSSCAMHSARATCCGCGRHARWLSRQDLERLIEIVDAVGRSTSAINLRQPFVSGLSTCALGAAP